MCSSDLRQLTPEHSTDALLLDATFRIASVDQKKYDRVARLTGVRDDLTFTLDVNCELYPVAVDDTVQLSIASTLSLDGVISGGSGGGGAAAAAGAKAAAADAGAKGGWWRGSGTGGAAGDEATLADQYDYVCYGKMYRFEEGAGDVMSVLPSSPACVFGCGLTGPATERCMPALAGCCCSSRARTRSSAASSTSTSTC